MPLKIFIYKIETGELVSEHLYTDFLFIFNNLIAYNFLYENDQKNLIVSTDFPPKNLKYINKEWIAKDKLSEKEYTKLIKLF